MSLSSSDVIDGVTHMDKDIAESLRRSQKPVMLAVNKADNEKRSQDALQFYELALGDPLPISAYHDIGADQLLDMVELIHIENAVSVVI